MKHQTPRRQKKGIKRTHPTPRTQNPTFYIVPHPQFCPISSFPYTATTYTRVHARTTADLAVFVAGLLSIYCRFA